MQSHCQHCPNIFMEDFRQRFEIIYKKFFDWGKQNGFKPSKLAFSRFLGVSQGAIQNWEYKGTLPAGKDLKTIHDKLGFSYDWLITGEGDMFDEAARLLAEKDAEIERLKEENRKLTTHPDHDGMTDEKSLADIAKAAGQE